MALVLRDIYNDSKNKFQLELIAGAGGLDRIMTWVYVAEDYTTSDYLRSGELVITTGVVARERENWLLHFLKRMVRQHVCGLIINEGKYIYREDISPEIIDFCDEHNFPLFLMPWEIHIYDITKDYYNRVFIDTNRNEDISNAFLSFINRSNNLESAVSLLNDYGFAEKAAYYMAVFSFSASPENNQLSNLIQASLMNLPQACHLITRNSSFFLIMQTNDPSVANHLVTQIQAKITGYYKSLPFYTGISGRADSLHQLADACKQALAALQMGRHKGLTLYRYEDMGFFKLLLAISDPSVLDHYVLSQLHAIHEYDRVHGSDFSRTLYLYLLHSGSIKEVAAESFCHRNTINNRIRIIRETLGYDLDDPTVCFELMVAFRVEEYRNSRDFFLPSP